MIDNTRLINLNYVLTFNLFIFEICYFTDCSLEYALEAASLHPARALGIDDRKGKLNFGYDADFVMLDPEQIKIKSSWIAGECVYKCDKN